VAWFAYTALPDGVENPVKVMSDTAIRELTLSKCVVSDLVKVSADGILRLVREVENPDESGKQAHIALAQAKIPDGVNKALAILISLAKPDGDLVFQSEVQDLAGFKGGDWFFLNLTSVDVGVLPRGLGNGREVG
jgi:hypothetical protein